MKINKQQHKILSNKSILKLLSTELRSFPLSYYFTGEYIDCKITSIYLDNIEKQNTDFKSLFKKFIFYFKYIIKKKKNTKKDILFISRYRPASINKKFKIYPDYLFGELIEKINKEHKNWKIEFTCTSNTELYNSPLITTQNLFYHLNIKLFIQALLLSIGINRKWKLIKKNISDSDFNFDVKFLDAFFSIPLLTYNISFDYSLHNLISATNPRVILANDDVLSLKPNIKNNTKLIVVQSASINKEKEKYLKYFIFKFNLDKRKSDYFLVSGSRYKKLKEDVGASKEVVVTGQLRYDILYHAKEIYNKEKFIKRYKINPNHKIILWTTANHGISNEEIIKNFKAVFEAMRNLKDVTLVIKQHPGESEEYTKLIKKYLKKYKINAIIPPKNSDVYEQIFVCDLMITKTSTTAMEAVALNKPVIVLNLSGEPDVVDYVEQGIALGVYKGKDLKSTIEKLLKDDSELLKNRKKYIKKYLYKIDGKAAERVVEVIKKPII